VADPDVVLFLDFLSIREQVLSRRSTDPKRREEEASNGQLTEYALSVE
jgi:hypothetical protein